MPSSQKVDERRDLGLLAEAIGFPRLKEAKDCLHPDFVLHDGFEVLGLEHTLLHSDQPPGGEGGGSAIRRAEAVFAEFRSRAKQSILDRFGHLEVALHVDPQRRVAPDPSEMPAAMEQFIELVSPHLFPPAPEFRWSSDGSAPSALSNFVDAIRVTPWPGLGQLHWQSPTIGWAATMVYPTVADHIREKDEKRRTLYVKNCSRAWLLLVATGTSAASMVTLPEFDSSTVPPNSFERVYLLDRSTGGAKLL